MRRKPYTEAGIRRVPCFRSGRPSKFQWQVCTDNNVYRPICEECDIAINTLVIMLLRNPRRARKLVAYQVDHMGDDAAIVQAARVSYGKGTKTPSDDRTLICYKQGSKAGELQWPEGYEVVPPDDGREGLVVLDERGKPRMLTVFDSYSPAEYLTAREGEIQARCRDAYEERFGRPASRLAGCAVPILVGRPGVVEYKGGTRQRS